MLISNEYRSLNERMHDSKPHYGLGGARWADDVATLARGIAARTILDYGSGKSSLSKALMHAFEVYDYDPAIPANARRPSPADLVVCTDVLEHVEPECLIDVLGDMAELAEKAVFLVVATCEAAKHLPDGRNAHLMVASSAWWVERLMRWWRMDRFRDLGNGFVFIGKAL